MLRTCKICDFWTSEIQPKTPYIKGPKGWQGLIIIYNFFFAKRHVQYMCHKINLLGWQVTVTVVKLGFGTGNLSVHFQEIADFIEVEFCANHFRWVSLSQKKNTFHMQRTLGATFFFLGGGEGVFFFGKWKVDTNPYYIYRFLDPVLLTGWTWQGRCGGPLCRGNLACFHLLHGAAWPQV